MAAGETLILEARDFKDPQHWRWLLKDSQGKFLADHEVGLDSGDPNYTAFMDMESFLKANSSPDRWLEDQMRLMEQVGSWIGKEALGSVGERISKFSTPVTVLVKVPPEASGLLYRPWEMAIAGGKPLALRNASLVYEIMGEKPEIKTVPVQDRLRMLAVFSLPTDASSLSLRRERYQLMKLIRDLAQTRGFAIDMRILQYGTTRESLQEALEEGEGWDLIHFSGHGDKALLILEKPDGSHDTVSSEELSDLFSLASGRLKLITLSACFSAAATVKETLEWLKIPVAETEGEVHVSASPQQPPMPALAVELMTKLDCAVLAMRYPIGDEFAINLASEFYRLLLEKGNTLPRSLQLAMQKILKEGHNAATPPLSWATPALFGSRSAELMLRIPMEPQGQFVSPTIGLSYFLSEPKRFVGRTGSLGRASSALARDSEKRGVLFQGMAGAGKTACALETVYHQSRSQRFRHFVWHQVPKENEEIEGSLVKLALDIEKQLPWVKMVQLVDRAEEFKAWLPVLSEMMEQNSILIVLDNLENLFTGDGGWKDERWGWLVEALLNHDGLSRLILTSRNPLRDLECNTRLIVEQINSLSRNEAMLLAREMPNLGKLLLGKSPVGLEKGRDLVRRTLALVQGHPKLIELADAQAADPVILEKYLESAKGAWSEEKNHLDRFFLDGESARTAGEFLAVLNRWTQDVSRSLPPASRTLLQFLCALEDSDRLEWIVKQVWPMIWISLGLEGDAPALEQAMSAVKSASLVEHQSLGEQIRYDIHPSVSQAGLEEADEKFRGAVDAEMASFWIGGFQAARSGEPDEKTQLVIMSGLRSAPYLIRQKIWPIASTLLQEAFNRDRSPGTVALILPLLRHIAQATKGMDQELFDLGFLANILRISGRWQDAEDILRPLIAKFAEKHDFRSARVASLSLFYILLNTSRFRDALELTEERKTYTQRAGLGVWFQIEDEIMKLQALNFMGSYEKVLRETDKLRIQIRSLAKNTDEEKLAVPWNVIEVLLDTGRQAAMQLEKYEQALMFNAELANLKKSRGTTDLDMANVNFNDYGPYLRLNRYNEAEQLLWACKDVFEKEKSFEGLSKVFTALADLVHQLGQSARAVGFEETALRYSYKVGNPKDISISHNNLANYLGEVEFKSSQDHRLAAAIIRYQIVSEMLDKSLGGLAHYLNIFGSESLPESFDQLCDRLEQVDGVHFRELWVKLPKRAEDGDQLLKALIEAAKSAGK